MSLTPVAINTGGTSVNLGPDINVATPFASGFEKAQREVLQKEFKESLETSVKPETESVQLEEDLAISVRRKDFADEGLDSLVKGLSQEELQKKREEEAEERSKYISYADELFPEIPSVNLSALSTSKPEKTNLTDQMSQLITARDNQLGRLQLLEEAGVTEKLEDVNIRSSWIGERLNELMEGYDTASSNYDIGEKAYSVGEDIYGFGKDTYDYFFGDPTDLQTVGGYDLAEGVYRSPYSTGYLGTMPTQSSIGLSSAPPASLAGVGKGTIAMTPLATGVASNLANMAVVANTPTGLGTLSSIGAAGRVPFQTSLTTAPVEESFFNELTKFAGPAFKIGTGVVGLLSAAEMLRSDNGLNQMNGIMTGLASMNSLGMIAIPGIGQMAAVMAGMTALLSFGFGRRGKPKRPFGGADLALNKSGYFSTTAGYGYNGYKKEAGQAGAATVSDYLNALKDHLNVKFYVPAWQKAIKEDERLGRYDVTNMSGHADPSVLIRKILEIPGFMQGAPSRNGQPITSQEEYEKVLNQFNEHYAETAFERGGLYNATRAGISQPLQNIPEYLTIQHKHDTGRPDPNSPLDYYGRHTRNLVSYSSEEVTSAYDLLYRNIVGQFNRGSGGTHY